MNVLYALTYFSLLFLVNSTSINVKVNEGILEGKIDENKYGDPFYSFRGIPYAEPPIGDLRFKAPQPAKSWDGVRDAKIAGSSCFSYDLFIVPHPPPSGSEDCLYLNVYSPNITTIDPYPVMVWIHGGGFISGSSDEYQPEFLVRKGVIIVTINYRLEVLGFLSLGTEDIPGNAGMKDQVAALRWVKKNIINFGGDPDNITIFGESAGGVSVSYLLTSPMSKGLFKRAIVQSGTSNMWWPNTFRPRDRALLLAKTLGCNSNDDREITQFFKSLPVEAFVKSRPVVSFAQELKEAPAVYFGIVPEKRFGDNEIFFEGDIYESLRNGIHDGVEVMNGYTKDEGTLFFSTGADHTTIFEQANVFLEFFVPEPLTLHVPLTEQLNIGEEIKKHYLNDIKIRKDSIEAIEGLLSFTNFEIFVYGTLAWQKAVAKTNRNKLYLYKFTCVSERNVAINASPARYLFDYRPMVGHADDLGYLFPLQDEGLEINSETFKLIDQVTGLWTNFAKYGNPTPNNEFGVQWLPYTLEQQNYMDVGNTLVAGVSPDNDEMEYWENIFREYYPHVLP